MFDSEPESVAKIDAFLAENGFENDFASGRQHREIYLSDVRKTAPEKWRTVVRHPIRPKETNRKSRSPRSGFLYACYFFTTPCCFAVSPTAFATAGTTRLSNAPGMM